jgi:hypothetical protein
MHVTIDGVGLGNVLYAWKAFRSADIRFQWIPGAAAKLVRLAAPCPRLNDVAAARLIAGVVCPGWGPSPPQPSGDVVDFEDYLVAAGGRAGCVRGFVGADRRI